MWVVKLGGSLANSDALPLWLDALRRCGDVAIVPGGGPFAELVREAQVRWACGDQAAHDMAILGMRQFGHLLADIGSLPKTSECDAGPTFEGRSVVWLPTPEALNGAGVPASWDISSDSIAAWLAGRLPAANLLLIKRAELSNPSLTCSDLVARNVVDAAFPDFFCQSGAAGWIAGPEGFQDLVTALATPADHFRPIER